MKKWRGSLGFARFVRRGVITTFLVGYSVVYAGERGKLWVPVEAITKVTFTKACKSEGEGARCDGVVIEFDHVSTKNTGKGRLKAKIEVR